ncbi:MAG: hypothetical protein HS099_05145 [Ardenticatenaceae bacterium]|nr:hypothetical protein [Ardenticatenaceae bacterium]
MPPHSLPAPGPTRLTAVPPPQKSTAVTADGRAPTFTSYAWPKPADGRTPTTKKHGRHCRRPCPHIHLLCLAQTGRRPYPHHKKARPLLPTAVPPHSPPMPGPNRPTAVPPPQKARPLLPTAVPPHSPPMPGPNRPTAVHPPQKNTAVIADGRAPTFTSYAWPKPADGRTPTTKKHGRHC